MIDTVSIRLKPASSEASPGLHRSMLGIASGRHCWNPSSTRESTRVWLLTQKQTQQASMQHVR